MSDHDTPLTSPEAWVDAWIRHRSVMVERWHRVVQASNRLIVACGRGYPKTWPAGGGRLEVARPFDWSGLPGDICPRCLAYRREPQEVVVREVEVDDALIDAIVERVTARLAKSDEEPAA